MNDNQLTTINQNAKLALTKSKNLLDITKKILDKKELVKAFQFKPFLIEKGHSRPVNTITISPDGKYIVSGSDDNTIKILDFKTAECLKTIKAFYDGFTLNSGIKSSLIFNEEKIIFLSKGYFGCRSGEIGTIRILDIKTDECLKDLDLSNNYINLIVISPDRKFIVTDYDHWNGDYCYQNIQILDSKTGMRLKTLEENNNFIFSLAISSNGKYIISGNGYYDEYNYLRGMIRIWDIKRGTCLKTLENNESINSIAISSNGKYIVSGSCDNLIKIWKFSTGECLNTLEGHKDSIHSIVISLDEKYIVSGSADNTIKIWDFKMAVCLKTLEEHEDSVNSIAITPDGKYIVSGSGSGYFSGDNTIKIWDTQTGKCLKTLEGTIGIDLVTTSLNGKNLVFTTNQNEIKKWEMENNSLTTLCQYEYSINSIAITPDSNNVIVCGDDKIIKILDIKTGKCLHTLEGHTNNINILKVKNNDNTIVSQSYEETKVWDIVTRECIYTSNKFINLETTVFTSDRKILVSAKKNKIKIQNIEDKNLYSIINVGEDEYIRTILITPNGKYIVSKCDYEYGLSGVPPSFSIKIWDLKNTNLVQSLELENNINFTISPLGKIIIPEKNSFIIKVYDIEINKEFFIDCLTQIIIDRDGYFTGSDENIDKCLRVSEEPLTQRKLTLEEINHFRKKSDFFKI